MRPRDTTERAAAIHAELNRTVGPEARFRQAMEMSELARAFAKAALRRQHPDYSDEDLVRALTLRMYPEVPRRT